MLSRIPCSASLRIGRRVGVLSSASVAGRKEGEGPLRRYFDRIEQDAYFGESSWEKAESAMLRETLCLACRKP